MELYLWPRMETMLSFQNRMILFQKNFKSKNLSHFLYLKNRDYFAWRCNWNYYWRLPVDGLVEETDKIFKDLDTPSHHLHFQEISPTSYCNRNVSFCDLLSGYGCSRIRAPEASRRWRCLQLNNTILDACSRNKIWSKLENVLRHWSPFSVKHSCEYMYSLTLKFIR